MWFVFLFPVIMLAVFSAYHLLRGIVGAPPLPHRGPGGVAAPILFVLSLSVLLALLVAIEGWRPTLAFVHGRSTPPDLSFSLSVSAAAVAVGWLQYRGEARLVRLLGGHGRSAAHAPSFSWPVAILVVGPAALLEELVWRGFLPSALHDAWGLSLAPALLLSSAAFGLHHHVFGRLQVLLKMGHGLIWALLALVSGTLLPALVAHLTFNIAVLRPHRSAHGRVSSSEAGDALL